MISKRTQFFIWILLLIGWVLFSRSYHPTLLINVIATVILLSAYAGLIYFNFLFLLPQLWRTKRYFLYGIFLIISMGILTFVAFTAIRTVYTSLWNPEQLGGYWQNYLIDFIGMIIHLLGAITFVTMVKKVRANPA